jgi:DNA-binding MarR family transcriptional regulator
MADGSEVDGGTVPRKASERAAGAGGGGERAHRAAHKRRAPAVDPLSAPQLRDLLRFRTELRHFLRWSEQQAEDAGLTPMQHQLLLAVTGHDHPEGPRISDLAGYLLLRHHSVTELVNRAAALGLVTRTIDSHDARVVRVRLTARGGERLAQLSAVHAEELRRLGPALRLLVDRLGPADAQRP